MSSFARRMAIFTQNSREYPKTSGAIPRGLRPLGIALSVFGFWIFSLVFHEYFAIRLAKLDIVLHYGASASHQSDVMYCIYH